MSKERRIVTVCTRFKDLKSQLADTLPSHFEVVEVPPPLEPSITTSTDYLIADFPYTVGILFEKPGRLKWIQGTWAGIDKLTQQIDFSGRKPTVLMSRLCHPTFSQLMAEYSLAAVINIERGFKQFRELQSQNIWDESRLNTTYRCLNEVTIGILGVGEIGFKCATIFKSLGCRIVGLVNRPREGDSTVSTYYVKEGLPEMLSVCDYVINILPATSSTNGILGNDMFKHCKNAGFINIGRGNVCSEEDIIRGLDNGWLREAFLDVYAKEPLPSDSPLWSHPKVTVTPHVAGDSRTKEICECFVENLQKIEKIGKPGNLIDWDLFY